MNDRVSNTGTPACAGWIQTAVSCKPPCGTEDGGGDGVTPDVAKPFAAPPLSALPPGFAAVAALDGIVAKGFLITPALATVPPFAAPWAAVPPRQPPSVPTALGAVAALNAGAVLSVPGAGETGAAGGVGIV